MNSLITAEGVIHLWNQRQIEMRKNQFLIHLVPERGRKVIERRASQKARCNTFLSASIFRQWKTTTPPPTHEAGQWTRWVHQYSARRRPDKQWLAHQVKMSDSQSSPAAAGVKRFCRDPRGGLRKECVESKLHLHPPPAPQLSLLPPLLRASPSSFLRLLYSALPATCYSLSLELLLHGFLLHDAPAKPLWPLKRNHLFRFRRYQWLE